LYGSGGSEYFAKLPVDFGVKVIEPRVAKDELISAKMGDVKSFGDTLPAFSYDEVEEVGDLASFVCSPVDVVEVYRKA
jgi:hypothetical protein